MTMGDHWEKKMNKKKLSKEERNQKGATISKTEEAQNTKMEILEVKEMKKTVKDLTNQE